MSDKIDQRRTENAVSSRLNLSLEEYRAVVKHPLRALPPEVRPAALAVWTCNKHLKGFESALPIAAIFSVWIDRHGLLPEDASAILFGVLAPGKMQKFEFSGQLMTHMAGEVSAAIAKRQRDREGEERRAREAKHDAERATEDEILKAKEIRNAIGRMPG